MIGRRESDPSAFIAGWWQRAHGAGAAADEGRRLLDDALSAVWRRAGGTLGDITLTAILERVLSDGATRFDVLRGASARFEDGRLLLRASGAASLAPGEVEDALLFVIAELIGVVGRLTADILTPALLEEVAALTPEGSADAAAPAEEREPSGDGEERGTSK